MKNDDDFIELVKKRLSMMPPNIKIHSGNETKTYDKKELLSHVEKQDEIGKNFVQLQKRYIEASMQGFMNV